MRIFPSGTCFLLMPVISAEAERSFSLLRRIKIYMRSCHTFIQKTQEDFLSHHFLLNKIELPIIKNLLKLIHPQPHPFL